MRYVLVLLIVALTLAVVASLGPAAADQEREDKIAEAVNRFIGLPDARIEIEPMERARSSRHPWQSRWSFAAFEREAEVPAQTGTVYYDEEAGVVYAIYLSYPSRELPSRVDTDRDDPPAQVRQIADRIVAECTPFDTDRLQEEAFSPLLAGGRLWTFAWQEAPVEPRVRTGGRVVVSIWATTHQPWSVVAYAPRQIHTPADVAVGHDEARQTAVIIAEETFEGYEVQPQGTLVLSSLRPGAGRGPSWVFTVLCEGRAPEAVVIDAMTGEHIP